MTITILKLEAGQKIPRPFNRASNHEEMAEMIAGYEAVNFLKLKRDEAQAYAGCAADQPAEYLDLQNLDSEQPVRSTGKTIFYAFTEGK